MRDDPVAFLFLLLCIPLVSAGTYYALLGLVWVGHFLWTSP